MQKKIDLAQPRDFGELIGDTFTFVRQNLKPLLKYFFIFCGFFVVATTITNILAEYRSLTLVVDPNDFANQSPWDRVLTVWAGYLPTLLFATLQYVVFSVMVLSFMTIYKQKRGEAPTTAEMWGYIKFFFLKVLGATILLYILLIIGLVFCLIPGVYLSPVFALVAPVMVLENTSFGYAFNKSFRLINNNWWVTFGMFVVLYIILFVLNLIISLPASLMGMGNLFLRINRDANGPMALIGIIITNVLRAFLYFFHSLLIIAAGLCYYSLSESKEGSSLIERMDQFGRTEQDPGQKPEEY